MLIKNGLVFLVEEKGFVKRDIWVEDGKIKKISKSIEGTCDYDCEGKYIMPGLIEAHSHIGIWEEGIGWEGDDGCESDSPTTPAIRAIDAINPMDIAFKEALSGGVTVACTGPGSANVIAGQFAIIKLAGDVIDDMIIKEYAAMKCAFGENPKACFGKSGKTPMTRMGIAYLLRKSLVQAKNYKLKKEKAMNDGDKYFQVDFDMEALLPVINGEVPLKCHVHRADDICTAIRIAKEFDLKMTLDHCTEGHLLLDHLSKHNYPAIVGPSFGSKSKVEINKKSFKTAKLLNEAGIKISITTDHNVLPQESLIMCAAMSVKAGLDEFEALKAVTINPAEILGIEDFKGRLSEKMDADLSIWSGHPLNLQSSAEVVIIEGKEVFVK
ncbi:MAG: amidohydrolase [Clostridium sp.]|uniref:amidohydrolase n=1 Tax=Clostridium sp. TaxID=1506 RepID=UPI003022F753